MQLCHSLLLIAPHCLKYVSTLCLSNLSKFCLTHFSSLVSCHSLPCPVFLHTMAFMSAISLLTLFPTSGIPFHPLSVCQNSIHLSRSSSNIAPSVGFLLIFPHTTLLRQNPLSSESDSTLTLYHSTLHSAVSFFFTRLWVLHFYIHYQLHSSWYKELEWGKEGIQGMCTTLPCSIQFPM